MHEVTARPVRTIARRVVGATQLRLVLGMALGGPQLGQTVCELTTIRIAALTTLLVGTTQFRLVATTVRRQAA